MDTVVATLWKVMKRVASSRHLLVFGLCLFLGTYALVLVLADVDRYLGGLAYHVPPIVALAFAPRVLRRTRGTERAGWILISALLVTWDAAEWVYSFYSLALNKEAPIPSLADALYYAGYIAFACALPLLARPRGGLHSQRAIVDATIVVVVTGTLFWWFLIAPGLPDSGASSADYVLVGYPLLDLGLFATLVVTFYGGWRNYHPHVRWLMVAVAVLIASDVTYSLSDDTTVAFASWLDLGWLAGYCFIAMAIQSRGRQEATLSELPTSRQSTLSLFLPYVALCPLLVAMAMSGSLTQQATTLTGGAVAATALIMLRQWLTLFENQRLYASLEAEAAELDRLRELAAFQADHDELTGLLNRRAWFAAASAPDVRAVALLDIDNFKMLNDRFGHPAGDAVLKVVGATLIDLLPPNSVVGRVGGEEFAVAFKEVESVALIRCRAALRGIARTNIDIPGQGLSVTLSAGIAALAEGRLLAAYEQADQAMYRAKRAGRNRAATSSLVA